MAAFLGLPTLADMRPSQSRRSGALKSVGILVVKFWLMVSPAEQLRRFREREETPFKRYKLTAEDWRNREKWDAYVAAACEMIERTGMRREASRTTERVRGANCRRIGLGEKERCHVQIQVRIGCRAATKDIYPELPPRSSPPWVLKAQRDTGHRRRTRRRGNRLRSVAGGERSSSASCCEGLCSSPLRWRVARNVPV